MRRTRIKFCGMTRIEDAIAAADAGADAIGMVLHSNTSRKITRELAKSILSAIPPFVTPVGLFVDAEPVLLNEIADDLGLRHLQLHGHEPVATVEALCGRVVIKAVRMQPGQIDQTLAPWKGVKGLRAILLETAGTRQAGGTGVENDWEAIRQHQSAGGFNGYPSIIAAGGLRPENVEMVVRTLRPFAVDVSTGIESSPGVKSIEKMREFVAAVRRADESA